MDNGAIVVRALEDSTWWKGMMDEIVMYRDTIFDEFESAYIRHDVIETWRIGIARGDLHVVIGLISSLPPANVRGFLLC